MLAVLIALEHPGLIAGLGTIMLGAGIAIGGAAAAIEIVVRAVGA